MESLLQSCRENFGAPPRRIRWSERAYLHAHSPQWVVHDELRRVSRDRNRLLSHGRIVLGALVQANWALYEPGSEPLPALALWSHDPFFEANPRHLRELVGELQALKGKIPTGDLAEATRLITNETARPLGYKMPESFGEGRSVWMTTLLVFQQHLPCGFLSSMLLPLLVNPEETPCAPHSPWQILARRLERPLIKTINYW